MMETEWENFLCVIDNFNEYLSLFLLIHIHSHRFISLTLSSR